MRKWILISALAGVALLSVGLSLPARSAATASSSGDRAGSLAANGAAASRPRASWYVASAGSPAESDSELAEWLAALDVSDDAELDHARSRVFAEMRMQIRNHPALIKRLE